MSKIPKGLDPDQGKDMAVVAAVAAAVEADDEAEIGRRQMLTRTIHQMRKEAERMLYIIDFNTISINILIPIFIVIRHNQYQWLYDLILWYECLHFVCFNYYNC